MVIPAAASIGWYSRWLRHRLSGLDDREACDAASCDLKTDPKSLRRYTLPDPRTSGGSVTLSIPVRKGSGLLSDHGNWPHVHLGTLNALYGRKPYFPFLYDQLQSVLANVLDKDGGEATQSLAGLNLELHRTVTSWIDLEAAAEALNAPLAQVCREFATKVNFSTSILDAVFRFGKDTVFVLLNDMFAENET